MPIGPQSLLMDYVNEGKLDPQTHIEVLNDSEISIVNIHSTKQRNGVGRAFLQALKLMGVSVHVLHPMNEAMPFWRKMWDEGLINDDPDQETTWESFLTGLECQMSADVWAGDDDDNAAQGPTPPVI